ncbi:MAG: permease-like cell division protein FtsX [Bacteroidetes bacterium]|nr:permease-like cell division protein FtsX [Bacteroidota bacterium]MDA0903753.1 permease-like cell division protein FtsX [Bacteroidota bacterium]MDA1242427.1 permease-like cell division protein FtsX [Bacteroidota bacterium]
MGSTQSRPSRRISNAQLTTQFTTVVGMSLTLFLLGSVGLLALFGHHASLQLRQQVHIQVYLQRELAAAQVDETRLLISADPSVYLAEYIDPAEASAALEEELGESFVTFLGEVPLPPVIQVRIRPEEAQTPNLAEAVRRLESVPSVAEVVWHKDLLSHIESTLERWIPVLWGGLAVCLLIALALLNNTIRLTVFARRFLIRNMQLVGARPRLVRRPFILQGMSLGGLSGLLAFAGWVMALSLVKPLVGTLQPAFLAAMGLGGVCVGLLLGGVFSALAVNRYLRADLSKLH